MQKLLTVLEILKKNFPTAKFRELAGVIRFNAESLNDGQVLTLAGVSVTHACEIKVKRSGPGLVVIVIL